MTKDMSMKRYDNMEAIRQKLSKMNLLPPGEFEKIRNTEGRRKKLLQYLHLSHILRIDGLFPADEKAENMAGEELKQRIARCTDEDRREIDTLKLSLISEHTHSWYIARHYYEKCSKILCQMMVTIMDYTIKKKTGSFVLYTAEDDVKTEGMEKELGVLSTQFEEAYYYLCAYDYCTGRLADYVDVKEYKQLMPEHCRITANGLPDKLDTVADAYNSFRDGVGVIADESVLFPERLYDEPMLEAAYAETLRDYKNTDQAMEDYLNMVSSVSITYRHLRMDL